MRIILFLINVILLSSCSQRIYTMEDMTGEYIAREYRHGPLSTSMESSLQLNSDHTFHITMKLILNRIVDLYGQGKWHIEDGRVVLKFQTTKNTILDLWSIDHIGGGGSIGYGRSSLYIVNSRKMIFDRGFVFKKVRKRKRNE